MPILVGSTFSPARGGHAPGDVRDAFIDGVEAMGRWRPGDPEPTVELRDRQVPIRTVAGLLWNCSDSLPGSVYDELQDLGLEFQRRSYAAAARTMKPWLAQRVVAAA